MKIINEIIQIPAVGVQLLEHWVFFSLFLFSLYCDFILLPFSYTVSLSVHVFSCDIDVYSAFAVIFNILILCLEVAYDSMRLF